MPIAISCPQCDQRYQADESLAGKKIKCKQCGAGVRLPGARPVAAASSRGTRTAALAVAAAPRARAAQAASPGFDPYGLDDGPAASGPGAADPYGLDDEPAASRPGAAESYRLDEPLPRAQPAEEEAAAPRGESPAKKAPKQGRKTGAARAADGSLKGVGRTLLLIGLGSFVLPMIGLQFRLINVFGEYQGTAGVVAAILGAILLVVG